MQAESSLISQSFDTMQLLGLMPNLRISIFPLNDEV